jgi:hypothetical protein
MSRVGKLEALDGVPVERRKPLPVIGAVVHQPIAWLRVGETLGCVTSAAMTGAAASMMALAGNRLHRER